MGPHQSIENKALLATPEDESSIRGLADEVFSFPRSFPRMPPPLADMVKERLVRAEISYERGEKPGIHEQAVVRAINNLSAVLGGPPHSTTTLSQVRVLRMWLALSEPRFMGTGITRQNVSPGESINPVIGPLQAVHPIASLIDQKFINPDFQVSQQEWEETSRRQVIEKIQTAQARLAELRAGPPGRPIARLKGSSYSSEKRRELEGSLSHSLSSLTLSDGLNLVNHTMAILGID
jgi:hypothetical protein